MTTIKTKTIETCHGPKVVAAVSEMKAIKGVRQFCSHEYNSQGQAISGGFYFSAKSEMAKRYGVV